MYATRRDSVNTFVLLHRMKHAQEKARTKNNNFTIVSLTKSSAANIVCECAQIALEIY